MEQIKLFDSELKLMELVWEKAPVTAKELAVLAEARTGWNKNTSYTILKKLIEKRAVQRDEPNFICTPLITKEQVRHEEVESLIDKLFDGSIKTYFASFLGSEKLTGEEIEELKRMIDKSGG